MISFLKRASLLSPLGELDDPLEGLQTTVEETMLVSSYMHYPAVVAVSMRDDNLFGDLPDHDGRRIISSLVFRQILCLHWEVATGLRR